MMTDRSDLYSLGVRVEWFETTDHVVWTGRDGKPRCARHPYICLVPGRAIKLAPDLHYCANCMGEALGRKPR